MRVVIRVDASTDIGTGHVMRCLTLATALKNNQHDVTFICRELAGNLINHIKQCGFDVISLKKTENTSGSNNDASHANWLQVSWQDDANECNPSLSASDKIDWIIVDHYALDKKWESALKHHCSYMMAIDDLADREHVVEILLDQNLYSNMEQRYINLITEGCLSLTGPKYALLRKEFTTLLNRVKTRTQLNNILVFFGGVDAHNLTLKTITAIQQLKENININIIIGNTNPNKQTVLDACSRYENMQCHINVSCMAEFMLQADLAIGAGGTTTWERCYLGLPAIVFTIAQNQAAVNQAVAEQGACILAGDTNITEAGITAQLKYIIDSPKLLSEMSASALSIMQNHLGANSVAQTLETFRA